MSLGLQYALIALAVLVSAAVVMHKQLPGTTRRLRAAIALPLLRTKRAGWLQAIGRRVAPAPPAGDSACGGCSSGCSTTPGRLHE